MSTFQELKEKAETVRTKKTEAFNSDGQLVDGWANAARAEFTFEDGEKLSVGRDVLWREDFGSIQWVV